MNGSNSPRIFLFPLFLGASMAGAQTLTPSLLTPLSSELNETSGLVFLDGSLWTHLDSGNPHALYQVDPDNGTILRTVEVSNASNVDWEDLAADAQWVYIGDFGNNAGARTDLAIYRISRAELLDPSFDSVIADTIRFSYADQVDFTPANNATNWDCEAMIAMDDSLFLFTKNWVDQRTYRYALSALPGAYQAVRRDTLNTQGMITGASFDAGAVALCGYTNLLQPFVWLLQGFDGHDLFGSSTVRHPLQIPFTQVEGVAWSAPGHVYMSNEQNALGAARLWDLALGLTTAIYPIDPADRQWVWFDQTTRTLKIEVEVPCTLRLHDVNGKLVRERKLQAGINTMVVASISAGSYVVSAGTEAPQRIIIPQ